MPEKTLLIGIDVGGTNTDSVLLDPTTFSSESRGVIAYHKSSTTADVSGGISEALDKLSVEKHGYSPEDVLAVTIGTTHFINAVVERDRARLAKVAVIRLCGPYSKGTVPFSDFPSGLTSIMKGYTAFVNGGHRVDGSEIQPLDEKDLLEHARKIKALGIKAVAVVGIFSIINKSHELRAAQLLKSVLPDGDVVMSHTVSRIGLIPRENATILNASIMSFAAKIIRSFIRSVRSKGFNCPIMLTQNDGTVLTVKEAFQTPIRTFSSGATNSMRGAAFLCAQEKDIHGKSIVVVDIGGTTSDVGLLLPSGYPRQSMSYSEVGGVRVNFSMPHVESIGLGGGSIVRESKEGITVGPDSVGSDIKKRAKVFGGDTVTSTDVTVALSQGQEKFDLGDRTIVDGMFSPSYKEQYQATVKAKLERVIDTIRTSPEPLPVLLVGGGSFISPTTLDGALKVYRPPYYQVANAIGAAMGKLSASIQKIEVLDTIDEREAVVERMKQEVTAEIVAKGAIEGSIDIVELSYDPVPYVDRTFSFEIKVVGDIDFDKIAANIHEFEKSDNPANGNMNGHHHPCEVDTVYKNSSFNEKDVSHADQAVMDYEAYKPFINKNREWIISETDLDFIRIGTYILGCGGGGSPYPIFLETRNMLREGAQVRVINLHDAGKYANGEGKFITLGFAGSPTVADEQIQGNELIDAAEALFDYSNDKPDGVLPLEIGGGNGFRGLFCGASTNLNIPVIDADLMGRAYPAYHQILPCVLGDSMYLATTSVSDGNGNKFLITGGQSDFYVEKMLRAALAEIGAFVGIVNGPMSTKDLVNHTVHHSLSTAWRLGRAVRVARQKFEIENLPERIIDALGGSVTGKKIFAGKIIGIEKKIFKGHVYGEVIIENEENDKMVIPFKNENIVARVQKHGSEKWEIVCSVPDLISVCDADNGEAVGTPDYRYGILVFVLALSPSNLWVDTERAMETGGPKSFGPAFENVEYNPVGKYVDPVSVIDEYST